VRLMGDGLSACFRGRPNIFLRAVVSGLAALRTEIAHAPPALVLIDVTQGVDLYDVRSIAADWPEIPLVALGLVEQRQQVIRCGRAGFTGYVTRDACADSLCGALEDVLAGRLACPAEISGGLLRALFRAEDPAGAANEETLTRSIEPFFSTKENGMGMGLAICRSIIDAHGGRLWMTANLPRGAIFHFTLPAHREH